MISGQRYHISGQNLFRSRQEGTRADAYNAATGPFGIFAGMRTFFAGVLAAPFALCGLLASADPAIGPAIRKGRIGLIRLSPPRPGTDAPPSELRWTRGSLRAWCASARVRDTWLVSSSRSQPTGFEPTPFAGHHAPRQILLSSRQEGTGADADGCSRRGAEAQRFIQSTQRLCASAGDLV